VEELLSKSLSKRGGVRKEIGKIDDTNIREDEKQGLQGEVQIASSKMTDRSNQPTLLPREFQVQRRSYDAGKGIGTLVLAKHLRGAGH